MTYAMTCSNGWTTQIEASSLAAAKRMAAREATHDAGSYSLETPDGEIHSRRMWLGLNAWGWDKWERVQ